MIARHAISEELWTTVLLAYPFLAALSLSDRSALRRLTALFLARKEFTGAHGLQVSDFMAVSVAAQACLPVLRLTLDLYDSFIGIVLQPEAVSTRQEWEDEDGVVHSLVDTQTGEYMPGGPLMLCWSDIAPGASALSDTAYNVVIHEFAHVLDMGDGALNGRPALQSRADHLRWDSILQACHRRFVERLEGTQGSVVDAYGATAIDEFFAVSCEAFFTASVDLQREDPALYELLRDYFLQDPAGNLRQRP